MRPLPFLLALLLPSLALAQARNEPPFRVRVDTVPRAGTGARIEWTITVANEGPALESLDVRSAIGSGFSACSQFALVDPFDEIAFRCSGIAPNEARRTQVTASVRRTTERDPVPVTASADVDVVAQPDLTITFYGAHVVHRGARVDYGAIMDDGEIDVRSPFVLTFHLAPRVTLLNVPASCTRDGARLVCTGDRPTSFRIDTQGPADGTGEPLITRAELRVDDPSEVAQNGNAAEVVTHTFRTLVVSNADDAGAGSLRSAFEGVNEHCVEKTSRCEIVFERALAIQPLTPLPRIQANAILIDGGSDKVEIDGSLAGEGDGIALDVACGTEVRGLVINGFRGAGLAIRGTRRCRDVAQTHRIANNFIGTDATGSVAKPNERGIVIERGSAWTISDNVISGNRRSGLFLWAGRESRIFGNRIGLRAHDDLPLGNGGSGVLIGPAAAGTDLDNNYVTFNREMGIAVAAPYVRIGLNSIHANGLLGIDIGLDGNGGGIVEPPRITSATYDEATGITTVEGTAASAGSFGPDDVLVFANDACGEGQYTLGRATRPTRGDAFTFGWPADLRGKFISATTTVRQCIGCFTTDAVSDGTELSVYTSTTEFGECAEVTASSRTAAPAR